MPGSHCNFTPYIWSHWWVELGASAQLVLVQVEEEEEDEEEEEEEEDEEEEEEVVWRRKSIP